MKRKVFGGLVAVSLALVAACGGPTISAVGEADDLVIIHDPGVSQSLLRAVDSLVAREVPWLLDEPSYRTTFTTPGTMGDLRNRRQIILVGVWGRGEVARLVRRGPFGAREGAPCALLLADDMWAAGQICGALVGTSENEVLEYLNDNGDELLSRFIDAALARDVRLLCSGEKERAVAEGLADRFGWSLCVPASYDMYTSGENTRFVFFRRERPDRSIFVYWQDGTPEDVRPDFALGVREELTARFYDGDTHEPRRPTVSDTVRFAGRPAVRVSAWWTNRELVGGGPFRAYCFHEPEDGRTYLVDVSLFAPGLEKVPHMRNLDAVAHTFHVARGSP